MTNRFGTTYSIKYAQELGLDPKLTYLRILDEFNFKIIRLCAYWDLIEPEIGKFDFNFLDFQIEEAEKRGIEVILAVGRKVPRWPEYHEPGWAINKEYGYFEKSLLNYISTTINRYKENKFVKSVQVENEAFLNFKFGDSKIKLSEKTTLKEIALAKSLTNQKIFTSDSLKWGNPKELLKFVDKVGVNIYSKSYKNFLLNLGLYMNMNYSDKLIQEKIQGFEDKMFIAELQAEPWGPKAVKDLDKAEYLKTASLDRVEENIKIAINTGIQDILLWGSEWWLFIEKDYPEITKLVKDFTFYRRSF